MSAIGRCPPIGLLIGIPRFGRQCHYIVDMDSVSHPTCGTCWAVVPKSLMPFHRDWHDQQRGASVPHLYGSTKREMEQLLQFVAALKNAVPASRPDFVAKLREALMAEAFSIAIDHDSHANGEHAVDGGHESRLQG